VRRAALVALFLVAAAPALALDTSRFTYERSLDARGGSAAFEPDGPMYEHSDLAFRDLRVLDAEGRQVPWRTRFERGNANLRAARLLDAGTEGRAAVALLDFGPVRVVRERISLSLPQRPFVGRAEVYGSDDRTSFTKLSSTAIYDVRGARRAVSTTVVFPPSDFRYYRIRATGVKTILGARAEAVRRAAEPVVRPATIVVRQRPRRTVVDADLHYRRIPVQEIRFASSTPAFDRPVEIEGSNDGRTYFVVGGGRLYRFGARGQTTVPLASRFRYVRIRIDNGDDEPLRDLRVTLRASRDSILLASGREPPYRVFYGGPPVAPEYDFAEQPLPRGEPQHVALGPERRLAAPSDTRSFVERNGWLVQAALALAAAVVGLAALAAFRRRSA
jgi:hypothetical protein